MGASQDSGRRNLTGIPGSCGRGADARAAGGRHDPPYLDQFAGRSSVVPGQRGDYRFEWLGREDRNQALDRREVERVVAAGEEIILAQQRNEMQPEPRGSRLDTETRIGEPAGNGGGDREVREF